MTRAGWCLSGLFLVRACGAADALSPQEFAFGMPVLTSQEAAAYRLALPLAVYQGTVREDLGDLRLFNSQGETVPYSLLRAQPPAHTHEAAIALTLFPLPGGARVVIDGARLTIELPGGGHGAVNQYILDGRGLTAPISALRLAWAETASDYSGRVKVEVSDDLGAWQSLVTAAPIANLHANNQALIENRVGLPPTQSKFWRLSWVGPTPSFTLTSVSGEPADTRLDAPREGRDVTGVPDGAEPDTYSFDVGAHVPVARVNVTLPEANMMSSVELSSRHLPSDPWRYITRGNFYRIKAAEGEQHNAPLDVGIVRDRYWRARILHGGGLLRAPPELHVEWVPIEVTFLASGRAPFLLVYGNAAVSGAETDLSSLPAATEIATATAGDVRDLGGARRLSAPPGKFPWVRAALWALLVLAVALLGWMALRLTKDTGR